MVAIEWDTAKMCSVPNKPSEFAEEKFWHSWHLEAGSGHFTLFRDAKAVWMLQGIQLGPTEASRYWIYWVPAQYVDAIKDAILGKWQFF